ncbi:hypothetical protein K501DRAFT_234325 [Backusella circina FSU 941]|nr:hypothetical protein K501DRAFT_234325 [Backusella circina FSU 941]
MDEISFEHFDPEFELGNLDMNGKPIKPRKKPGRKPNPPSPAQRKAQNRAAQRAFRERKRREMRDAETNIKKCLYMRDQAIKENKQAQQLVKQLQYENNYLLGQVLLLKIACMSNHVDVPKFYDTGCTDKMGSEVTSFSKSKDIPQSLEFFLNSKKHIVTVEAEDLTVSPEQQQQQKNATPPSFDSPSSPTSTLASLQLNAHSPPPPPPPQQQQAPELDPALMQFLLQPDALGDIMQLIKDVPPDVLISQVPPELISLIPSNMRNSLFSSITQQLHQQHPDFDLASAIPPELKSVLNTDSELPPELKAMLNMEKDEGEMDYTDETTTTTTASPFTPQPDAFTSPPPQYQQQQQQQPKENKRGQEQQNHNKGYSEKIYTPGPMSPLEAVNHMRNMRDPSSDGYLFTPTELQRKIPHDPRIDVIPGPVMRDYMIIFQDYYDANEIFNFLLDQAMFMGGELGNPDCWFIPPAFISKWWFICPNSRPMRTDGAIQVARWVAAKMMESLKSRKWMYLERERYLDRFPQPDEQEYDVTKEQHEEAALADLFVMHVSNNVPRLTSPNAFTI